MLGQLAKQFQSLLEKWSGLLVVSRMPLDESQVIQGSGYTPLIAQLTANGQTPFVMLGRGFISSKLAGEVATTVEYSGTFRG